MNTVNEDIEITMGQVNDTTMSNMIFYIFK